MFAEALEQQGWETASCLVFLVNHLHGFLLVLGQRRKGGGKEGGRGGREKRGEIDYTEGLLLSLPSNFLWMWTLTTLTQHCKYENGAWKWTLHPISLNLEQQPSFLFSCEQQQSSRFSYRHLIRKWPLVSADGYKLLNTLTWTLI